MQFESGRSLKRETRVVSVVAKLCSPGAVSWLGVFKYACLWYGSPVLVRGDRNSPRQVKKGGRLSQEMQRQDDDKKDQHWRRRGGRSNATTGTNTQANCGLLDLRLPVMKWFVAKEKVVCWNSEYLRPLHVGREGLSMDAARAAGWGKIPPSSAWTEHWSRAVEPLSARPRQL